jgi:peptidoglycan/xylan/chitin deacetylase (PgdA/CDA1 family)
MRKATEPDDSSEKPLRTVPRLALTTSWDDGHPLDLRVAELLAKYGLQGTFYIPSETGYPILRAEQVSELAKTFEVGAHTLHHVDLTATPDAEAENEIAASKRHIEEITEKACRTFCFPRGRFARRHVAMVKNAGFVAARTVELLSLNAPTQTVGLSLIPTTVQAYSHTPLAYWKNCAKRLKTANIRHAIGVGANRDWASIAISMLERAAESGGVFHLWGHSWEVEETGQWQALERVFAAMEQRKRNGICVTNFELCESYN